MTEHFRKTIEYLDRLRESDARCLRDNLGDAITALLAVRTSLMQLNALRSDDDRVDDAIRNTLNHIEADLDALALMQWRRSLG